MRKQLVTLCVMFCVASSLLIPSAHAQIKTWNPSCAQVLALGFEHYAMEHEKRTDDYSTAANVQRSARYIECKDADNARQMQVLAPLRKARAQQVEKHLATLEDALWSMEMIASGGGSMYVSFAAYSNAQRSDVLGNLIKATQRAKRSVAARNGANAQWRAVEKSWKRVDARMEAAFRLSPETKNSRDEYKIARSIARSETTALQVLAAQLPDETALILAHRSAQNIARLQNPGP